MVGGNPGWRKESCGDEVAEWDMPGTDKDTWSFVWKEVERLINLRLE